MIYTRQILGRLSNEDGRNWPDVEIAYNRGTKRTVESQKPLEDVGSRAPYPLADRFKRFCSSSRSEIPEHAPTRSDNNIPNNALTISNTRST